MMQDMRPIREFDHLMCGVKDVKAIENTFEALGFTVGPVTPLEGVGVVNRRILLTPKQENIANYLEFMQLGGASGSIPSYLTKWLGGSLIGEEGVNCYIMRTDDAEAACAHFEERHRKDPEGGFSPILLEKDFEQIGPDGASYDVGFSNCIMPDLEPPLYISTSQIRTLDFYLDDQWLSHKNGAVSWISSIAVSCNPTETAKGLQDIWGGEITKMSGDAVVTAPGEMPLKIFTPNEFLDTYAVSSKIDSDDSLALPYTAGVHISVTDLRKTRDFLQGKNINIINKDDCVIVPPELAHGLLICFEQEKVTGRP
jgi:hypothetical protein